MKHSREAYLPFYLLSVLAVLTVLMDTFVTYVCYSLLYLRLSAYRVICLWRLPVWVWSALQQT